MKEITKKGTQTGVGGGGLGEASEHNTWSVIRYSHEEISGLLWYERKLSASIRGAVYCGKIALVV